ncbi:MAG TPA: DUF2726 domain-containing protein [Steroidobacteraceae bacterium]|nr:DUF2726 domain-containing protein [Steroidobacteraceae bacterium]
MRILIPVVVVAALVVLALARQSVKAPVGRPYRARALLSPGEGDFFNALVTALPPHVHVLAKVRLGDLIDVTLPKRDRQFWSHLNRINRKHVDFVLCMRSGLSVLGAVELNDSSHQNPKRMERDKLVRECLTAAGIPLIEIKASRQYTPSAIAAALRVVLDTDDSRPKVSGLAH